MFIMMKKLINLQRIHSQQGTSIEVGTIKFLGQGEKTTTPGSHHNAATYIAVYHCLGHRCRIGGLSLASQSRTINSQCPAI